MISKPKEIKDRIILALDVDTLEEVEEIVSELKDYVGFFKIGLQLFTSCGFSSVKKVKELGGKVFFDGKFHDIPNTVAKSCANLVKREIDFFDIHLQGGSKMVKSTVDYVHATAKKLNVPAPTILGVTLLSSFGQKTLTQELSVKTNIDEYVNTLSKVAIDCGLDGVVASASEAKKIRQECGEDFIILCPAIRPTWSIVDDQIRVVTPSEAIKCGIDYMVIGRPITSAPDRVAAAKLITAEIEEALASLD